MKPTTSLLVSLAVATSTLLAVSPARAESDGSTTNYEAGTIAATADARLGGFFASIGGEVEYSLTRYLAVAGRVEYGTSGLAPAISGRLRKAWTKSAIGIGAGAQVSERPYEAWSFCPRLFGEDTCGQPPEYKNILHADGETFYEFRGESGLVFRSALNLSVPLAYQSCRDFEDGESCEGRNDYNAPRLGLALSLGKTF